MMNDFNAILGKVKNWANAAGKKTEEVVEASKLKLQIVSLNGDLSKAYEELGNMVYHAAKNNETVGEEMDAVMDKIDELHEKLAELESKVGEIKKVRTCGNCGADCPADAHFCSRCGVILEAVECCDAEVVEEAPCEECCECDCACDEECSCSCNEEQCECHCHEGEEHCCCDGHCHEEGCEGHKHEGCCCEGHHEDGCCEKEEKQPE